CVGLIGARGNKWHRRAARNYRHQIVPAAANAAGMPLDQFAQRNSHGFFNIAVSLDMAGNAEKLGAGIVGPANAGEPSRAAAHDVRPLGDRLDIIYGRWAAIESHIGRERRLEPWQAFLSFETFQKGGFLAADIGASAVMDDDVEVEAMNVVLADELGVVGLLDRRFEPLAFAGEFAPDIDVAGVRCHRAAGDQAPFDKKVRIMPHDLAILASAGLGLVGIDHEIVRTAVGLFRHERPFQTGRKSGAAAAALAGSLHFIDDRIAPSIEDRLGAVPGAAPPRTIETPVVLAV